MRSLRRKRSQRARTRSRAPRCCGGCFRSAATTSGPSSRSSDRRARTTVSTCASRTCRRRNGARVGARWLPAPALCRPYRSRRGAPLRTRMRTRLPRCSPRRAARMMMSCARRVDCLRADVVAGVNRAGLRAGMLLSDDRRSTPARRPATAASRAGTVPANEATEVCTADARGSLPRVRSRRSVRSAQALRVRAVPSARCWCRPVDGPRARRRASSCSKSPHRNAASAGAFDQRLHELDVVGAERLVRIQREQRETAAAVFERGLKAACRRALRARRAGCSAQSRCGATRPRRTGRPPR